MQAVAIMQWSGEQSRADSAMMTLALVVEAVDLGAALPLAGALLAGGDFSCSTQKVAQYRATMINLNWMTVLICRTIGADRGRAARGSPHSH